uniref:Uncharacterized protein n=1 Tax=Rhizophora mucronata TaxID=61149 RepID=A0A2P2QAD4_RHIMU
MSIRLSHRKAESEILNGKKKSGSKGERGNKRILVEPATGSCKTVRLAQGHCNYSVE